MAIVIESDLSVDIHGLLPAVEHALFGATDRVCLERAWIVTEAYRRFSAEPVPITRAMALREITARMTLDVSSNPIFAGNTSSAPRAWSLVPEAGFGLCPQLKIEHDFITDEWFSAQIPEDLRRAWVELGQAGGNAGTGHVSIDYVRVVNEGVTAILARLATHEPDGDESARVYRRAMKIACRAVIEWANRLADAAESAAAREPDPLRAACHRRAARACRRVPEHPAANLFEGLQSIVLAHLALVLEGQGQSISIGLADRALARFADEAAEAPGASADLIRAFLIAVGSNSFGGRGSNTQAITLGGADHEGRDQCNAVTTAFLRAFEQTPVADPHCFVRWHRNLDEVVWETSTKLLAGGRSMPLLVNDEQVAPALIAAGVAPADAWDYCIIGCNELGIPGRLCESAFPAGLSFNELGVLDRIVRERTESCSSMDAIMALWEAKVLEIAETGLSRRKDAIARHAEKLPMPFTSACSHACAEDGRDWMGGMPYHVPGLYLRGTANAINALAAIERTVFVDRHATLRQMIDAVDAADEAMLHRIAQAPKWGNDDDAADRWALALGQARRRALETAAARNGVPPIAVCHVVRSLHHLDGLKIGATLDGRAAREPVGDSIAAVCGTTRQGPTAILNSVLKLPASKEFAGIYNNNLTLPGNQARPEILRPLIEAFFEDGGQELQVNVLDAAKLKAAKLHPERYQDLVVRIAGLNARFIELSIREQDEIIRRAELA